VVEQRGEMESLFLERDILVAADCLVSRFKSGSASVFSIPSECQRVARVYMDAVGASKSAERVSLEGELQRWFVKQGVSEEGASLVVQLLDASLFLAHPRPNRWNRRGDFGVQERCRYLWYRHAARILGWCERKRFPDIVTGILRAHVFLTRNVDDEETREAGKGRLSAGCHAGPIAIFADRHSAGQFSCMWSHHVAMLGLKGECWFRVN